VWELPTVKTRSDAHACEVARADLSVFLVDEVERANGGDGITVAVLLAAYPIRLSVVRPAGRALVVNGHDPPKAVPEVAC
jgi:hypothetical protein